MTLLHHRVHVRALSIIAAAGFGLLAAFQLAIALGAPFGRASWVARSFMVGEQAMAKRLVRAKCKSKAAKIPVECRRGRPAFSARVGPV